MADKKAKQTARAARGTKAHTEDTVSWPWTPGPTTRAQRIRRALIG